LEESIMPACDRVFDSSLTKILDLGGQRWQDGPCWASMGPDLRKRWPAYQFPPLGSSSAKSPPGRAEPSGILLLSPRLLRPIPPAPACNPPPHCRPPRTTEKNRGGVNLSILPVDMEVLRSILSCFSSRSRSRSRSRTRAQSVSFGSLVVALSIVLPGLRDDRPV
jgi:hypothetical protein